MNIALKIALALAFLTLLGIGGSWGWWWWRIQQADSYPILLQTLYKRSVPLLRPDSVGALGQFTILDRRDQEEYAVSHLPGAIFVGQAQPSDALLQQLPQDRPILVYCSVGYRSEKLGERLLALGYTEVYNLYGGLFQWANEGRVLVNVEGDTTSAVHGFAPSWGRWVKDSAQVVYE